MTTSSIAALTVKYSRMPACARTVRAAAAVFDTPVEFVLLDATRAMVVVSTVETVCQPRRLHPAERALQAGSDLESTSTSTAIRVHLGSGIDASLSIAEHLDAGDSKVLTQLARDLSAELQQADHMNNTASTFESAVLAGLRDAVVVLDSELRIAWCNYGVVTLLGWGPDELINRSFTEIIHPDDLSLAAEAAASLSGGHRMDRLNLRVLNAYGNGVPVSVTGFDHSADPLIQGLVLSLRNDEREIESERALDQNRRVSSTILKDLEEAVIAVDELGAITVMNDAARRLFGVEAGVPAIQLAIQEFSLLDTENQPLAAEAHPLRPNPLWIDQEVRVATSGGVRHVSVSRSEVKLDDDRFGIVVTFRDITRARSDAKKLRDQALHDQLTGLANRRYVNERLESLKHSGTDVRLGACFVGIDKFKNVNDIHGHRAGDAVLRSTAQRLRTQIREGDVLARAGGDEFLVILVDPQDEQTAREVADRIRSVFDRPFEVEGNRLHLTASVGIAFEERGNVDDEQLLQHADIALYAAKDNGGDCIEFFDQALATLVAREQLERNMVRDALDKNALEMHFQAIVDSDGNAIGVEALARCLDAEGKLVLPAGFMEAIDGTSLMVRLDRAGFVKSCQLAAILENNDATNHMWVASNFSAMSLAQSDFADTVLQTIADTGISPASICIEVTETAAFEPGESSVNALTRLRDAGLRIALDDFGTGYSSLSHLRDLPLTTVKIDRSFTSELHKHGAERAIATAVRDIAESLGFTVVAEGVETAADREAVQAIGVDSMQGWLFSRAVPQDELLASLHISLRDDANA